jgi:hypothetical protein
VEYRVGLHSRPVPLYVAREDFHDETTLLR